MTVREALEKKVGDSLCGRCSFNPCRACIAYEVKQHFAEGLAPIIERALRTTAVEMLDYYYDYWDNPEKRAEVLQTCITAGVAAMMAQPEKKEG